MVYGTDFVWKVIPYILHSHTININLIYIIFTFLKP